MNINNSTAMLITMAPLYHNIQAYLSTSLQKDKHGARCNKMRKENRKERRRATNAYIFVKFKVYFGAAASIADY